MPLGYVPVNISYIITYNYVAHIDKPYVYGEVGQGN